MKKLLLSGITAVALMAAGPAKASDLTILGETGVFRTPIAMSLAPSTFAFGADYVTTDETFVPMYAAVGLPYGIEIGGSYWYVDVPSDPAIWNLNAKVVLPPFVEGLGLAFGGRYTAEEWDNFDNDGHDLYAVATYAAPMGEGMTLVPSFGVLWRSLTGDNEQDAWKFFGSVLFKMPQWCIGAEYVSADEDIDNIPGTDTDLDGSYWFGARYYLNPMITLQAGYANNTNWSADWDDFEDGVFNIGAQFAFGGAK